MIRSRRSVLAIIPVALTFSGLGLLGPSSRVAADNLPKQLSDRVFWRMVSDFSEPNGYFRSDNLLSNELALQEVIPDLAKRSTPNGVYLGVGPDQNFTYITALRPRMAFIIDIRRGNMLEHLMYKALIEMSDDRIDFLSRLFSRPRPSGLDRSATPKALLDAYVNVPGSEPLFHLNMDALWNRLVKHHGFDLTVSDRQGIEYIYRAFMTEGPELRYSFPRQNFGARWFPTYTELMTTTDRAGENHSYIANEANFKTLRDFQQKNLLIPIVGDFAGDKAVQSVGRYVREHGATVNYFYTSNVEQYLFQTDAWQRYYTNVAGLPLDASSTFVRAYFNMGFRYPPGIITPDLHSVQLIDPINSLLSAVRAGDIRSYDDLVDRAK